MNLMMTKNVEVVTSMYAFYLNVCIKCIFLNSLVLSFDSLKSVFTQSPWIPLVFRFTLVLV